MSTDHENLITEARAIPPGVALDAVGFIPDGEHRQGCVISDGASTREGVISAFRLLYQLADALEASEKAHAPTDDELEALATVIDGAWGDPTWDGVTLRPLDRQIADAVLAAGFRRTVQSEPTDAGLAAMLRAWIDGEPFEDSQARTGQPVAKVPAAQQQGYVNGYAAAVAHVEAILDSAPVQGEPNDTRVIAALIAYGYTEHDLRGYAGDRMRAALRAAGVVSVQDEPDFLPVVLGRKRDGDAAWMVTEWRPDEIDQARRLFPDSEYVHGKAAWVPVVDLPEGGERRGECKHYADLYGRCMDCGMTWAERAPRSAEGALSLVHRARALAEEWRRYDDTEELVDVLVMMANQLASLTRDQSVGGRDE